MSYTTRWWHKPQTQFRLKLRPTDFEFNEPIHKQHNPRYYKHESKSFRTEQHKKIRHQNKILLNKRLYPDKTIEHTQGWGSN